MSSGEGTHLHSTPLRSQQLLRMEHSAINHGSFTFADAQYLALQIHEASFPMMDSVCSRSWILLSRPSIFLTRSGFHKIHVFFILQQTFVRYLLRLAQTYFKVRTIYTSSQNPFNPLYILCALEYC